MKLSAVIGASYGDEGKGHVVDFLAGARSLVVRHNGGAQAGHTVVTPGGCRHVFHHFGSGAFKGAATFLAKHFIVNPILFCKEMDQIPEHLVLVDPRCMVTTPWDMMFNQALENQRASTRHGSCGVGINETIVRNGAGYTLRFSDLWSASERRQRLDKILYEWLPLRAKELDIDFKELPMAHDARVFDRFVQDCVDMFNFCHETAAPELWKSFDHIIFEGAQGLRLDEKGKDFPHVTHSRTGLTNVVELVEDFELKEALQVFYVTRPYLTRHGAGPLDNELKGPPYPGIVDRTNQPHPHQGTIRYAWLDVDELTHNISDDLTRCPASFVKCVEPYVAVTCLDQVPEQIKLVVNGELREFETKRLGSIIEQRVGLHGHILFSGEGEDSTVKEAA
jgi:adenylosuccinate synthase